MTIDKFQSAQIALERFEKLYGHEVLEVFSIANGFISRNLTDGMVAGVPQQVILEGKRIWVVPVIISKKTEMYGEIGAILIEDQTHKIVGTTDTSDILHQAEVLLCEETQSL